MDLPSIPRPSLPDIDLSLRERLRTLLPDRSRQSPLELAAVDLLGGGEHLLTVRATNVADGPVMVRSVYVDTVNGDTPLVQDEMAELTRIEPGDHAQFVVSFSGELQAQNEVVLGIALEGPDGPLTTDATVTVQAPDDTEPAE